ncbi:hypothetical protein ACFVAD_19015 [Sutcliffiella sp. NPDC057660]|uniref:hypothetical protein n=1 Tax=Sutcliffiella sp. NPDC057660 TaxID=3346199 RepID=UPI0036A66EB2
MLEPEEDLIERLSTLLTQYENAVNQQNIDSIKSNRYKLIVILLFVRQRIGQSGEFP